LQSSKIANVHTLQPQHCPQSSHANEAGVSTLASLPDDPVANADTETDEEDKDEQVSDRGLVDHQDQRMAVAMEMRLMSSDLQICSIFR